MLSALDAAPDKSSSGARHFTGSAIPSQGSSALRTTRGRIEPDGRKIIQPTLQLGVQLIAPLHLQVIVADVTLHGGNVGVTAGAEDLRRILLAIMHGADVGHGG